MGRDSYSHRQILEFSAGIRIQDLLNYGLTRKTCHAKINCNITRNGYEHLGNVVITIQIVNKERLNDKNFIQFEYVFREQFLSFKHQIEIEPVYLGGHRYYFRCSCGRRVKALYFGGNVWACRHCLKLVYQNSRFHRNEVTRLRHNAMLLQKKADTLRTLKHPQKAKRIESRAYEYERAADEAMFQRVLFFFSKVKKRR